MKNFLKNPLALIAVLMLLFTGPVSFACSSSSLDANYSEVVGFEKNTFEVLTPFVEKEKIIESKGVHLYKFSDSIFLHFLTDLKKEDPGNNITLNNMCDCLSNADVYLKKKYTQQDTSISYHFNSGSLIHFLTHWESYNSGHIFDFDSSGQVDTQDLLNVVQGYSYPLNYGIEICELNILIENSHGWQAEYPGTYFAIVHTSPQDEEGGGDYEDCPLNTFWVELLYGSQNPLDSTVFYYYRNTGQA